MAFLLFVCLLYDFIVSVSLRSGVVTKKPTKETSAVVEGASSSQTTESEFISDKFAATSERDLDEVQENMTKLGLTATKEEKKTRAGKSVT